MWSKISNVLKRLGFRSRNVFAQLLSETSRACTIRVRRSSLGRLWNDLGSHACLHHRNRRPGTTTEERISGGREPHPESPNPRQVVVIRGRKSYVGGDRPPAQTEGLGRIGGGRETGYAAGLVPKAHRQQVRRIEVSQILGSSPSGRGNRAVGGADGEGKSRVAVTCKAVGLIVCTRRIDQTVRPIARSLRGWSGEATDRSKPSDNVPTLARVAPEP